MNLLKRLASLFSGGGGGSNSRYLSVYVLNRRCNEPILGQIDLLNELSKTDEGEYAYYTRKVLHTTGERRCFSQVEINLYLNQDKKVVHHEVEGGRWLSADEYYAELERFNAPPEEEGEEDDETTASSSVPMQTQSTLTQSAPTKPTPEESDHA
jgi:hypothetical protein